MTDAQSGKFAIVDDCAAWAPEIAGITLAAFEKQYGSGTGEVALIPALRADGDVLFELVALEVGVVVGHAMFSRLRVEPATRKIAALGPICAAVDRQRSGIGAALIREGLARCAALGFDAVALLGDPEYYKRFGFTPGAALVLESEFSGPHFQALELREGVLAGGPWKVAYPRAFSNV
jgi:putative acetyltransferase